MTRAPILGLALVATGVAVTVIPTLQAETAATEDIRIVDGDTVRVGRDRVRLVGFDAPELTHPRCMAERALAEKARDRLAAILSGDGINLTFVPCACPPGTEGMKRCNFGRKCAVLRAHGEDVAEVMIREGLAHRLTCGATRCPQRTGWCG